MKQLLILRHAKSSWKIPGLRDHDRPLNKRGKRDAPRIGRLLHREGIVPQVILSSTAKRARATARRVAKACGFDGELQTLRELYLAEPEPYLRALAGLPERWKRVLLVGHNPGLEELLERLTGSDETLPTAALAEVDLPIERWSDAPGVRSARLTRLWRPRELPEVL